MTLVRTQEIRLESLDDGPGLLPFKLGPTRLITHYHTFVQYIQLADIEQNVNTIKQQLTNYKTRLENDTYSLYELQIEYLSTKLDTVLHNLKTLEPSRAKRGLVDGLGSIIKSISGNLDYLDAVRYNNAIQNLENSQDKVISELNNHISISKDWMSKHNSVISQIVLNQNKISTTLELLLDKSYNSDNSLIKYAKFAQMLTIITENTNDLLQELTRIENILAFARALSTHHSMIDISILRKMIEKLRSIYNKEQVLDLDLREYYNIIKPGSYYSEKQIVIVFKFPIVSVNNYILYKLSIVPNKYHQILIPPYPLIATDGKVFVYIEAECPKVESQFLCVESANHQIRTQSDCIQELISSQSISKSCNMTNVDLSKEAMEQLDDRSYVVTFPRPTRVQLSCGREDYNQLHGSYLATLPVNCLLRSPEFTIINDNDEIAGQPLKIVGVPNPSETRAVTSPKFTLNSIDLRKFHNVQDKVMLQSPIQPRNTSPEVLYHTTIPFYVVLFSALALAIVVLIRHYYNTWICKKTGNNPKESPMKHMYEEPEKPEKHEKHPATFSLKI